MQSIVVISPYPKNLYIITFKKYKELSTKILSYSSTIFQFLLAKVTNSTNK